jgi:hypothetical protein
MGNDCYLYYLDGGNVFLYIYFFHTLNMQLPGGFGKN